ncbi:MAG: hypothetical protein QOH49_2078 [Acidobacteriota bacterium]|jgi:uncharacterized membrane protein|nr:hypothetical protein [Acidobacteriota bacterium]
MAEEQTSREILEQLAARIEHLERLMQAQTTRLYAIERRMGIEPAPRRPLYETLIDERDEARGATPTADPREATRPADMSEVRAEAEGATREQEQAQAPPETGYRTDAGRRPDFGYRPDAGQRPRAEASGAGGRQATAAKPRDLESIIGGSVFSWAGIILVTFAVAFSLKYAFDKDWISPAVRVTLGALAGTGLLVVGERLRRKGLRPYAYVLSGGGVLILYLSIYAAYDFYQLLTQPVAFLLMTAVTALAVFLSVRLNALPVAVLGLVGGFLTPVLLSTGQDNQVALFTYVSLLDAGVLAVAYFKRWRVLDFLSFAATTVMTLGWAFKYYEQSKLWTTLLFLSLFFFVYSLLAFFHNILPRRRSRWFDVALLASNATIYFGFCYGMLTDAHYPDAALATQAMLIAAFFAALFYAARERSPEDRLLTYAYVGAAVTFLTAAVAIQLELQWVTMVWAVEGLMLTWAGLRAGEPAARRAAIAVFAVALLHWLSFDAQQYAFDPQTLAEGRDHFVPLLNARALSCLALVSSLAGAAWLYRGHAVADKVEGEGRVALSEGERAAAVGLYTLAANGLALTLLTLDLSDYFGRQKALSEGLARERAEGARQFSLTALWSIYGAGLVAYGVRRVSRAARYAGLVLLVGATTKALIIDLGFFDAVWHQPLVNLTFMSFVVLVASYAWAVRSYGGEGLTDEGDMVVPLLVVVANILALVALSAEAVGYFESRRGLGADAEGQRDVELAKQLSLSVVWAVYGAGLLLVGRVRRSRRLRLMSLALLGLTTLKVFLLDLSALDRAYRIVSFIVLGAILLAVSYLYQKSQQRAAAEAAEEEDAAPAPATAEDVG